MDAMHKLKGRPGGAPADRGAEWPALLRKLDRIDTSYRE